MRAAGPLEWAARRYVVGETFGAVSLAAFLAWCGPGSVVLGSRSVNLSKGFVVCESGSTPPFGLVLGGFEDLWYSALFEGTGTHDGR